MIGEDSEMMMTKLIALVVRRTATQCMRKIGSALRLVDRFAWKCFGFWMIGWRRIIFLKKLVSLMSFGVESEVYRVVKTALGGV